MKCQPISRTNEHGVFITPQRIEIPIPATLRVHAVIYLGYKKNRWFSNGVGMIYGSEVGCGSGGGLPSMARGERGHLVREDAIKAGFELVVSFFKGDHQGKRGPVSRAKRALKVLNEWKREHLSA